MPIYEYQCSDCESQFELLIRGSEQPNCPGCHSKRLSKLLSIPAAHSNSGNSLPVSGPAPPNLGGG